VAWDRLRSTYDRVAGRYEARFLDDCARAPSDPYGHIQGAMHGGSASVRAPGANDGQ